MILSELLQFFGIAVAAASLVFGFVKWRDAAIHNLIANNKADTQKQIDEIKNNYAHRSEMDQSLKNVETMLRDMKIEQHRMSQRMDEFLKWLMQLQTGGRSDGG